MTPAEVAAMTVVQWAAHNHVADKITKAQRKGARRRG